MKSAVALSEGWIKFLKGYHKQFSNLTMEQFLKLVITLKS